MILYKVKCEDTPVPLSKRKDDEAFYLMSCKLDDIISNDCFLDDVALQKFLVHLEMLRTVQQNGERHGILGHFSIQQ